MAQTNRDAESPIIIPPMNEPVLNSWTFFGVGVVEGSGSSEAVVSSVVESSVEEFSVETSWVVSISRVVSELKVVGLAVDDPVVIGTLVVDAFVMGSAVMVGFNVGGVLVVLKIT